MLASLVMIAAAVMLFFNFIQPAYSEAQSVRSEQLSRQEFINTQKDVIQQAQALIQEYQGQRELQDQISYVLPLNPDVAGALLQLNSLALANGLRPDTFSIAAPSAQAIVASAVTGGSEDLLAKPIGQVDFQLRVTSSYEAFKRFLSQIETNMRIFDMKSLSVSPVGRTNSYTFDITVTTYYQTQ